jgi:hypothetical protein
MATQPPIPPQQPPWNPHWYGNLAQWVAPAVALLLGIISVCLVVHYRNVDSSAKSSDEHVTTLIDAKLNSAVQTINENIDKKLAPILSQLTDLTTRLGKLEGRFEQLDSEQKKIAMRLQSGDALARLRIDPDKALDDIRAELRKAQAKRTEIPYARLVDMKTAVQGLPVSAADYWKTVAAIVNYQSFIIQTKGLGPNPRAGSHLCMMTNQPGVLNSSGNRYTEALFHDCLADLDTNSFIRVTFADSIIRYKGGPVELRDVTFSNCVFDLQIPADAPSVSPARDHLLLALLESPDLKQLKGISTHY